MPNPIVYQALEPILRTHHQKCLRKRLAWTWSALGVVGFLIAGAQQLWTWYHPHTASVYLACFTVVTLAIWVRHRKTRPSLREIAISIEKNHPELQSALLTALDQKPDPESGNYHSLQKRVIREALDNHLKEPWDKPLNNWVFLARWMRLAGFVTVILAAYQIHQQPSRTAGALVTGTINDGWVIEPGHKDVEKGDAVVITARFGKNAPENVELVIMPSNGETKVVKMRKSMEDPLFGASLLSVEADTAYQVRFDESQSATYKLSVFEFPSLSRADAHLEYPVYTSQPARIIKDTLRVNAVEGTKLEYTMLLNKPVVSAKLVDEDGTSIVLETTEAHPTTYRYSSVLKQSGRYTLQLEDSDGRTNKSPPQLYLKVAPNTPPDLRLKFPSGDQRFSALEEVLFEGEAWDDFGLQNHGFGYQLSGQEPVDIQLGESIPAKQKAQLSHLLMLEHLEMKPGDLVSYYLWGEDIGPDGNLRKAYSDIYFGSIRPFEEIFRQGQPNAGQNQQGQQGASGSSPGEELAELQKDIITASWNIRRSQSGSALSDQARNDLEIVLNSQESAVTQAGELSTQVTEPEMSTLMEQAIHAMNLSVDALDDAVSDGSIPALGKALTHEQEAYQLLLKAQPNESTVTQGGGGGGGGGGRSQQQLNQLELSEENDRYETQSQAQGAQNEQQNQELQNLNRLKELARRQEDLNERLQELQTALDEAETESQKDEVERELKRLRDEQRRMLEDMDELNQRLADSASPENSESMQQLDQIREQAQKAADSIEEQEISNALASGSRAQEGLESMRDDFRERNSSQFAEAMQELRQRAGEMDTRQDGIQEKLEQALENSQQQSLGASDLAREAMQMSEQQQEDLKEIMEDIRRISDESEDAEPLLSRQLSETYRQTDQEQLDEMLETTRQLSRLNMADKAAELEARIHPEIETLQERVNRAAESILGDGISSLRRARDLLEELSEDLNREIAQANPGATESAASENSQSATSQSRGAENAGNGNSTQPDTDPATQAGTEPGANPGGGEDGEPAQDGGESPTDLAENTSQQEGSGGGPGNQGSDGDENSTEQAGRQGLRQGNSESAQAWLEQGQPGGSGGGTAENTRNGPLTGNAFRSWSDQLREAEEMVDVPELQNEIAAIRDRALSVRRELRNEGKQPQWDLVELEIEKPLYEVRRRIREELSQRLSREAVVPVDRDPVPEQFSELVEAYYETLGEGR
ncbi:MAG: hypothetical protein P8L18_02040 [Verrucomicrobiota bacterium]|nr:hypothetical protein [Verrucomicrobiota bacterium]